MPLPSGTILSQRYEIRVFVGSDGTLEVYKGLDLRLGRDVAITVLEMKTCQDPEKLLHFEKEAQIRAGLHHPRIMTVHDFGHDASCIFQIAEWLEGQSLRKRLQEGPIDWEEAMRIGRAVLEGLDVIHGRGFALKTLDATSVFLHQDIGAKLFAYDLRRTNGNKARSSEETEGDSIQALCRLLIQSLEEASAQGMPAARAYQELHDLAENPTYEPDGRRRRLEHLLFDAPVPRPSRTWFSWVSALLLLSLPGVAYACIQKRKADSPTPLSATPDASTLPQAPSDTDARRLYLYGKQLLENRDPDSLRRAETYLQGAITQDAGNALALSALADCYTFQGLSDQMPRAEAMAQSLVSSRRALELDPQLGSAHASIALAKLFYTTEWKEADREYRKALELSPGHVDISHAYGVFLVRMGRAEEGLARLKQALDAQPLSRLFRTSYGLYLGWCDHGEEGIEEFAKALDQDPSRSDTLLAYREILERLERITEAVTVSRKLAELGSITEQEASALEVSFENRGLDGYLDERIRQMEQSPAPDPVLLAELVTQRGDRDRALRLLARAMREGSLHLSRVLQSPAFTPIRTDPRFQQIIRRLTPPVS